MSHQTSQPGDGNAKADCLLVAEDVLNLFSIKALYEIARAVHRRARSMDGWGPGQMFVDDYASQDGSIVRFVYPYGGMIKVGLKDAIQFSPPTAQDGNHRSSSSSAFAHPTVFSEVVRLPGEFVQFPNSSEDCRDNK